jgi:hypothetical protein
MTEIPNTVPKWRGPLKTANGRWLDTGHVIGYAALGADTTWFIRAYLDGTVDASGLEGTSNSASVDLAGTFASEAAAVSALATLAAVLGGFDTSTLT